MIINYNNDSTIPELVQVSDIKAFNKGAKIHALQTLINSCKELDQRLVNKADFIKARNAVECGICKKNVVVKMNLNENKLCASCQKQVDREKKKKAASVLLTNNWKQLEKDLKELDDGYVFLILNNAVTINDAVTIKRTVKLEKDDSITFSIYREALYSNSGFRSYSAGHALRIGSNKNEVEATRLKKDFHSKNVAKSLHKKIEKLVEEYKLKHQRAKEKNSEKTKFIKAIMKELKVSATDINDCYHYPRGRGHDYERIMEATKKVVFHNLTLNVSTLRDKLVYNLAGIRGSLSVKQIKEIVKITNLK